MNLHLEWDRLNSKEYEYIKETQYSRVSQLLYLAKNVTLQSESYTAEFLYISSFDTGSYKTAVQQCEANCFLEKRMHFA